MDFTLWFLLVLGILLYFAPWLIATWRHHQNRQAIAVVNLFLGWTVIGWIIALAWAYTANINPPKAAPTDPMQPRNWFERILWYGLE